MITHELDLIGQLNFAPYFLTVYDIVRYAREQNILCQGRGSAANSAVCFCLGITSVNPAEIDLLFERFISAERGEPPDIDVDFEHERREEVIQYIYAKYGRHRAGLAATLITYRRRSAVRDVGKAMGLSSDVIDVLATSSWGSSSRPFEPDRVRELGLDPTDPLLSQVLRLTGQLLGFPRHLSQHVGGFVITRGPLHDLVPIANAAMEDRTVIEWDKDDIDALGILKIDVLALGMLTCIRKAFDLLRLHYGIEHSLASIPPEDPATYDMLCRADAIGVFQVESRAQMTMLPRLKPRTFYDLVVEVAIVRPGPIQGDMVHPFLRRRQGKERVDYPSDELRDVLGKTLGVPLFQEQAMKIAIVAAGFTPAESDGLRRAMATFRRSGLIHTYREKFLKGMQDRGYEPAFAERCFAQIEGFSDYGFPESHAASFARLAYISAWLKCHYPEVFSCAILNAQPMGFYSSATLVRDLREHDGKALPADINHSHWDHTLERHDGANRPSLRLGLRQIKGLKEGAATALVEARGEGYDSVRDLYFRSGLPVEVLERLAGADAFRSLGLDRRDALWAVQGLGGDTGRRGAVEDLPLFAEAAAARHALQREAEVSLPPMTPGAHVLEDYATLKLSLKAHPLSFIREELAQRGIVPAATLHDAKDGTWLDVAGLVLVRQRPGTASGVIFTTIEDETGVANVIIWPKVFEANRRLVIGARCLAVHGQVQKQGAPGDTPVIHLVAHRLHDASPMLAALIPVTERADRGDAHHRHVNLTVQEPPYKEYGSVLPKGRNFH